jgi:hypothetical protein
MKISKNVQEAYDNMILNCTECDELRENKEYNGYLEQYAKVLDEIALYIPEEKRKDLLDQLENAQYLIDRVKDSVIYQNGMHDAVHILKLLQVL